MRKHTLVILVLFTIMTTIGITLLLTSKTALSDPQPELKTIPFDLYVSNKSGFNLDKDMMHLGQIIKGGSAEREFSILNNHSYGQSGRFKIASNISMGSWFNISPGPEFYIQPFEDKHFMLYVTVPPDQNEGYYPGEVLIYLTPDKEKMEISKENVYPKNSTEVNTNQDY